MYDAERGKVTVIAGIERSFVLKVARMLYGEGIDSETDLIMSTLDIFGTNFWATLGRKFLGGDPRFTVSERLSDQQPLAAGVCPAQAHHLRPLSLGQGTVLCRQ